LIIVEESNVNMAHLDRVGLQRKSVPSTEPLMKKLQRARPEGGEGAAGGVGIERRLMSVPNSASVRCSSRLLLLSIPSLSAFFFSV
jgi:hypothetical protein